LLKLTLWSGSRWTFDQIAHELGLSTSAVHRSVDRSAKAGLLAQGKREVEKAGLLEFLIHGVRFAFAPEWGGEARGIPTAWAASPLARNLVRSDAPPPVWPDPHGKVRGISLSPLDPRVPDAVRRDERLGELLALVDAIRIGGARERGLAAALLEDLLASEVAG
jgi:hypothetical protein